MKITLIYPPQWVPLNPHSSLASLAGQLKHYGHDVDIKDLNIEFYNEVLTKDYLQKSLDNSLKVQEELFKEISKVYSPQKQQSDYSEDIQKKIFKFSKIKEFKQKRTNDINTIPQVVEEAVSVMRCKERFYSLDLLTKALNVIDTALELVSLPYYPTVINFGSYQNPFLKMTFEDIKRECFDRSTNIFYDFYEERIDKLLDSNADIYAISINSDSQIVAGLAIAHMLKNKTNSHISIGGNFFSRVPEAFLSKPEFFEIFADSLIIEEGETPIVELAKYVEGEISAEQVPNMLFSSNGKVTINEKCTPLKLDEMQFQDLSGFPLDLYFTPEIVLPIQASRGCYWKKCTFCDHDFGQNLNTKNIDKLINEIKYLKSQFGISYFEFVDESISPSYLEMMSKKVIEENLQINWFNNARLERAFTKDLLELARKAGLRMVLWGLESGSRRVMELINKGIDIDRRIEILRDSKSVDIWNFAFIFFGFPTETREDALKTIDLICENIDVISSYGRSVFTLGKHTRLRDNPEKYGMTEISQVSEFSPTYEYKTSIGMNSKEVNEIANLCTEKCNQAYKNPVWMYLRFREIMFLYICKYGVKKLEDLRISVSN